MKTAKTYQSCQKLYELGVVNEDGEYINKGQHDNIQDSM